MEVDHDHYVLECMGEKMKRPTEKRLASRQKMVQAAGAAFREHGFGGVGVDGLAKAAELTSGAFYFHFKNKLDAFVAGLEDSLDDLNEGIERFQREEGENWLRAFSRYYLGFKRTCGLGEACASAVLASEAERAGLRARDAYEEKMRRVFWSLERGLKDSAEMSRREQALALMALLAGGAMMGRTVTDEGLSEEIAGVVAQLAGRIGSATEAREAI